MHPLHQLLDDRGITLQQLGEMTGLSYTALWHIGNPNWPYKTHVKVAEIIAEVLQVKVSDIFTEHELSERGRPPLTGGTREVAIVAVVSVSMKMICPVHFIQLPLTGQCDLCEE